jgi:DNA-binding transcriptional regulator PaaX
MAWSIALSTLLCYYPPELPASAPMRVGELFGIADGTIRAALSGLVAAEDVAAEDVAAEDGVYRLTERLVRRSGTGSQRVAAVETMGRRPGDGCGHPPPASRPSASPCARA